VKGPTAELALQRFGLGARPGEIAQVAPDVRGYLAAQIGRGDAAVIKTDLPPSDKAVQRYMKLREEQAQLIANNAKAKRSAEALAVQQGQPREEAKADLRQPTSPDEVPRRAVLVPEIAASFNHAVTTPNG
jgi:uncharacterized protein (DUF1800 family)